MLERLKKWHVALREYYESDTIFVLVFAALLSPKALFQDSSCLYSPPALFLLVTSYRDPGSIFYLGIIRGSMCCDSGFRAAFKIFHRGLVPRSYEFHNRNLEFPHLYCTNRQAEPNNPRTTIRSCLRVRRKSSQICVVFLPEFLESSPPIL